MDKTVLLSILQSRKILVLKDVAGKSDLEKLQNEFVKLLQKDESLAQRVGDPDSVIFQIYNDQFKENVDIDNGTNVPNEARIFAYIVNSITLDSSDNLGLQDECNLDDLDSSPYSSPYDSLNSVNHDNVVVNSEQEKVPKSHLTNTTKKTMTKKYPVTQMKDSQALLYPSQLPQFSNAVKTAQAENRIIDEYLRFVRECGSFITGCTPNPTRSDYNNFCRTIGDHFTSVRDRDGSMTSFKLQLTKCVRNMRYRAHKPKPVNKDGSTKRIYNKSLNLAVEDAPSTSPFVETLQTHKNELLELSSGSIKAMDRKNISQLMKETYALRREAVLLANKCADVIAEYPALLHQQWLVEDYNRVVHGDVPSRIVRYDMLMQRLQALSDICEPVDSNCDKRKINLLFWASKQIGCKKDLHPLEIFSVNDTFDETCDSLASAFVRVYLGEDGAVAEAVLLAEGRVLFRLQEKSVFHILDALLGAYYVFNVKYPVGYAKFLKLLQENVLGCRLLKDDLVGAAKLSNLNKKLNNV